LDVFSENWPRTGFRLFWNRVRPTCVEVAPGTLLKESAMNILTKVIVWIVLSLFAALGAKAQDATSPDVQAAKLVICGSAEKAQLYAAQNQDIQAAMADERSNTASAPCLVAGIAYISGRPMERVSGKDGTYDVTEILIVGVATPYGMLPIEPSVVYTLLKVTEEAA
jgi:hypothetical protein